MRHTDRGTTDTDNSLLDRLERAFLAGHMDRRSFLRAAVGTGLAATAV